LLKYPMFIKPIGYFYIFGALVIIITLFSNPDGELITITDRVGLSWAPEIPVRIGLSLITLVVTYYYLKLTRIGFWLMMVYSGYFISISSVLSAQYNIQPYIGNTIFSLVVFIYTVRRKKYFIN
jgi:hypothetical protein